ncbi:MAG TPA: tRNA (N6-isopentenyl adenosine(37)-C2)-methylthiotransferase MiaB [Bacteroidales bacterium]|mgnify:CR=1 FL=1|nr:tRNA (N6-isopentenyl adenosine(37)-C2)-methylthiotransferase MiaB [Bacteroidales bacterium]HNZ43054.1 tRNA (N6-isopentenyl adenosine(37)-C2)-methylthiotransferase MiaB [Bacteroidales bacterium]HOH83062.1 tRNA (N6-isopentenyl adenosine(37)-C2)-methylthiotransferase MiaB [Bacteroidales bacterium]HPB24387.1 tRNA (N6-isopentenyl adenosine(37)-C2)-methylthiotransferase MiaB [Bacteroidales bacterium]HPI31271.1 tRNA (N6-isopentenyl adenosine(37)-C2)-methylthiotransferase MiaB [Bacteroidales bacteri
MKKTFYIETYGCQMNFSDSEIVASILTKENFSEAATPEDAGLILLNTCSIRENAEQRIFNRLRHLKSLKKKNKGLMIGILGCMAERLKEQLFEDGIVDIVAGPDSYRELPQLIFQACEHGQAFNILLSAEETYADINPVRIDSNGVSAFISIMRGCQNFCSYCVVPYTRGKERSRSSETIISEATGLFNDGFREITLLGQNVNSYNYNDINFPKLLSEVALINPALRIRFATSHPKDLSDELIDVIASHDNICKSIHLPLQSGSNRILKLMKRNYTRESYMDIIEKIYARIPGCSLSTDIISGFCSETEQDHEDTLDIMRRAAYDSAFMFKYSERQGTFAAARYKDDVPEDVKTRRLNEIIALQNKLSLAKNKKDVGKTFEVLIEGRSKKSESQLSGRNSQNKVVVFTDDKHKAGDYVMVKITGCTSATLKGEILP